MANYNPYKWHRISDRQIPDWVKECFGYNCQGKECGWGDGDPCPYGGHHPRFAKGKHYEYKIVVTTFEHTHDDVVIRRKLKHHKSKGEVEQNV